MTAKPADAAAVRPHLSFEYFPPKTPAQAAQLDDTVRRLASFNPDFVSVTYGAAGTTQNRSVGAVARLMSAGCETAAHLTCAGSSAGELRDTIQAFRRDGVTRFVALRGDSPGGMSESYAPHPEGFAETAALVRELKRAGAAEVSVSAYPERHPQSPDWATEMAVLKGKADAGADRAITQFFYDNDVFEAYLERVRRAGIDIPIVAGIMPIHRYEAVVNFASRCGASVPGRLAARFDGLDPECVAYLAAGVEIAASQIADLRRRGLDAFHIYTLNRAALTEEICRSMGREEAAKAAA